MAKPLAISPLIQDPLEFVVSEWNRSFEDVETHKIAVILMGDLQRFIANAFNAEFIYQIPKGCWL